MLPRFLIVAPPKSGSTHVANVVRRYFQIEELPFSNEIDWTAEHNLTPTVYMLLRGHGFCFNFHMLAHRMNLQVAQREHMRLIVIWRNLGDIVVSLDDHIIQTRENGPMYYIRDFEKYAARPAVERHAWLIDAVIPWYLTFYLNWRSVGLALHPYEHMLHDRHDYFSQMLAPMLTHPPVEELLEASLGAKAGNSDRLNVGRAGRSARMLSEANRRRLEENTCSTPIARSSKSCFGSCRGRCRLSNRWYRSTVTSCAPTTTPPSTSSHGESVTRSRVPRGCWVASASAARRRSYRQRSSNRTRSAKRWIDERGRLSRRAAPRARDGIAPCPSA